MNGARSRPPHLAVLAASRRPSCDVHHGARLLVHVRARVSSATFFMLLFSVLAAARGPPNVTSLADTSVPPTEHLLHNNHDVTQHLCSKELD